TLTGLCMQLGPGLSLLLLSCGAADIARVTRAGTIKRHFAHSECQLARSIEQAGWHVGSLQDDEVAGVSHLSELGRGNQILVGLSIRRSRPILLPVDEMDRCCDLGITCP